MDEQYKEGQLIGKDSQGVDVCIGDYIMKNDDKHIRYQVRVRNGMLVKHFGGGYMELEPESLSSFVKVWTTDNDSALGMGASLFNSKVID